MLCRIDDFLICKVRQYFSKNEKQRVIAEEPFPFDFPVQYARELFIFCVAITYSSMTPLMIPFVAGYFGWAFISGKKNVDRILLLMIFCSKV